MKPIKLLVALGIAVLFAVSTQAGPPKSKSSSVTIPQQILTYSEGYYLAGQLIPLGFDVYGYNYQAHKFKGYYVNAYLNSDGFPPYTGDAEAYVAANPDVVNLSYWADHDTWLEMAWNDAWISNKDSDGDGILDRHYGTPDYRGSGAWLTNHLWGQNEDGSRWNTFAMFVAAPLSATAVDGVWYDARGRKIGPVIWDSFAIVLEVTDTSSNCHRGPRRCGPASSGWRCR